MGEAKFASKSFIPSGLFSPSEGKILPPRAEAIFSGNIEEFKKIINRDTGCEFYWVRASTLGGEIDVVMDRDMLKGNLVTDGIISAMCWLSGKIVGKSIIDKESF